MIPDLACVEVKDRADDALSATRAAVEAGIGPGGGTALLRAKVAVAQVSTENPDVRSRMCRCLMRATLRGLMVPRFDLWPVSHSRVAVLT